MILVFGDQRLRILRADIFVKTWSELRYGLDTFWFSERCPTCG